MLHTRLPNQVDKYNKYRHRLNVLFISCLTQNSLGALSSHEYNKFSFIANLFNIGFGPNKNCVGIK